MKKIMTVLLTLLVVLVFAGCTPSSDPDPGESEYIPADKLDSDVVEVTMLEGKTFQLNIKVLPEGATDTGLVYKSLNTAVATVDENGLVTAVKEGVTDIMVMYEKDSKINLPIHIIVKINESDPGPAPAPSPAPAPEPTPSPSPEPDPEPAPQILYRYVNIREGVSPEYYPVITFYDNGEFEFYENMYEGMVTYLGTYSMDGPDVTVYPDYIRFGQNISPADLGELKFYKLSPTYLIMKSTAYLSEYDDIFVNGPDHAELAYVYSFPMDGIADDAMTRIEMYTDRTFIYYENFYAGIDEVHGVFFTDDGVTFVFTPTLVYSNSGFEYKQFRCEETQAGFKLLDDLRGIGTGDLFTKYDNKLAKG
ncbi:MAG: Ig-like domain-containing protein [Erysipelotrichaceae bacterium]|nr:Ig-like domain-containing protein [Erysipelotrichaceae bacterium]